MSAEERAEIAIQGLRDIVHPLGWLRREDPERKLSDDYLLGWIRNPLTYVSIARVVLQALGEDIDI